jgi:hypothetical protein
VKKGRTVGETNNNRLGKYEEGEGMWRNSDGDTKYTKFKPFVLNFQGTIN